MTEETKNPDLLCADEALYKGWEDYYLVDNNEPAWGNNAPPFLDELLEKYLPERAKIGDFGAGDARNSLSLAKSGHDLTLIDISSAGLERARRKAISLGLRPLPTLVNASLEQLPLADDQFELALCIDALSQVYRPWQALKEMARTMMPGGPLIINVFTPADCAYGEGEQISGRSFLYKNTLFHFFEDNEFRPLLTNVFNVIECRHVRWQDPPHHPFRPCQHTHDALVYVLQKP